MSWVVTFTLKSYSCKIKFHRISKWETGTQKMVNAIGFSCNRNKDKLLLRPNLTKNVIYVPRILIR